MSKREAMKEYITSMNEVDLDWMIKVKGQKSSLGLGVGVSTMVPDLEEKLSDNQKSIYDWCKEGQVDQVQILLSTEGTVINQPDTEGLTLLHWACDRGYLDIVKLLLKCGANLNAADSDGQTPLHYACTCEHLSIVDILVKSGADVNAKDLDGCKPTDNTLKKDIHKLITESVSDVS
ncbi:acyl-CoA-binding domain-containing protein 6-like [Diadema antillarum]|uniref:acyl-CoA-binding domain-containing protein 6-like n=1 Tax=Diadema antillarum TaxID=105358 RepID=UPI003A8B7E80